MQEPLTDPVVISLANCYFQNIALYTSSVTVPDILLLITYGIPRFKNTASATFLNRYAQLEDDFTMSDNPKGLLNYMGNLGSYPSPKAQVMSDLYYMFMLSYNTAYGGPDNRCSPLKTGYTTATITLEGFLQLFLDSILIRSILSNLNQTNELNDYIAYTLFPIMQTNSGVKCTTESLLISKIEADSGTSTPASTLKDKIQASIAQYNTDCAPLAPPPPYNTPVTSSPPSYNTPVTSDQIGKYLNAAAANWPNTTQTVSLDYTPGDFFYFQPYNMGQILPSEQSRTPSSVTTLNISCTESEISYADSSMCHPNDPGFAEFWANPDNVQSNKQCFRSHTCANSILSKNLSALTYDKEGQGKRMEDLVSIYFYDCVNIFNLTVAILFYIAIIIYKSMYINV